MCNATKRRPGFESPVCTRVADTAVLRGHVAERGRRFPVGARTRRRAGNEYLLAVERAVEVAVEAPEHGAELLLGHARLASGSGGRHTLILIEIVFHRVARQQWP